MGSPTHPPSGVTANRVLTVAAPEDVGASYVLWLAAVGVGVFETIDAHASRGSGAGL